MAEIFFIGSIEHSTLFVSRDTNYEVAWWICRLADLNTEDYVRFR